MYNNNNNNTKSNAVHWLLFVLMCLYFIFIGDDRFKNGDSCTSAELWCPQFITEHVHSMTICGVASMKSMYPVAWKPKYFLFSAVLYVCSLDLVLGKCNLVICYNICCRYIYMHLDFLWSRKLQQRRLLYYDRRVDNCNNSAYDYYNNISYDYCFDFHH